LSASQRGIPDQMWVIALGQFGIIGLIALTTSLLMPIWLLMQRIPVQYWKTPGAAAVAALAMLLTLHMCDNLFNAMVNPIFIICCGGLTVLNFTFKLDAQTVQRGNLRTPALPAPGHARPFPA
jgi:O-antigen ligase